MFPVTFVEISHIRFIFSHVHIPLVFTLDSPDIVLLRAICLRTPVFWTVGCAKRFSFCHIICWAHSENMIKIRSRLVRLQFGALQFTYALQGYLIGKSLNTICQFTIAAMLVNEGIMITRIHYEIKKAKYSASGLPSLVLSKCLSSELNTLIAPP